MIANDFGIASCERDPICDEHRADEVTLLERDPNITTAEYRDGDNRIVSSPSPTPYACFVSTLLIPAPNATHNAGKTTKNSDCIIFAVKTTTGNHDV